MQIPGHRRLVVVAVSVTALLSPTACAADDAPSGESAASRPSTSTAAPALTGTTPVATPPPAPATRTVNLFDLAVGDCLADPPPVDPNVIAVAIVDCATEHQAEVYLRAPLAVNTALADVADRTCGVGFSEYTGRAVGDGPFTVTYLIDSNQNRTSSNPNPSTVICILQSAAGTPLTESARR